MNSDIATCIISPFGKNCWHHRTGTGTSSTLVRYRKKIFFQHLVSNCTIQYKMYKSVRTKNKNVTRIKYNTQEGSKSWKVKLKRRKK